MLANLPIQGRYETMGTIEMLNPASLKMVNPGLFHCLFSVFSSKHRYKLQQIYVKKSIQYMVPGLNPRPSEHESPPITTRPGLPPIKKIL